MMDKAEIIKYLKENPKELYEVSKELGLRFPYENREALMEVYNHLKGVKDYFVKKIAEKPSQAKYDEQLRNVETELRNLEDTYQIFNPEFDETSETRWIPRSYSANAKEIFDFRKEMFNTQGIYLDKMLTDIISGDMGDLWEEKGGQDGMYDAFPLAYSARSFESESEYMDGSKKRMWRTECVRSYALDGAGGIGIIEKRTYTKDGNAQERYSGSVFQIVTLGEDDAYHFLNGAEIYEYYYGNKEGFLELLNDCFIEYKRFTQNDKKHD